MNITETFVDGLVSKSQIMPLNVMQQACMVLLDYLGVLVGGRKYLKEKHPELVTNAPSEAFLNGFAAHVLELDDGHRHGMIHLGASIVTAVLNAHAQMRAQKTPDLPVCSFISPFKSH